MTNLEILNSLKLTHRYFPESFHFDGFDMCTDAYVVAALPCNKTELKLYVGRENKELTELVAGREKDRNPAKILDITALRAKCHIFKIGETYILKRNIRKVVKLAKMLGEKTVEFLEHKKYHCAQTFKFKCGAFAVVMSCPNFPPTYEICQIP